MIKITFSYLLNTDWNKNEGQSFKVHRTLQRLFRIQGRIFIQKWISNIQILFLDKQLKENSLFR